MEEKWLKTRFYFDVLPLTMPAKRPPYQCGLDESTRQDSSRRSCNISNNTFRNKCPNCPTQARHGRIGAICEIPPPLTGSWPSRLRMFELRCSRCILHFETRHLWSWFKLWFDWCSYYCMAGDVRKRNFRCWKQIWRDLDWNSVKWCLTTCEKRNRTHKVLHDEIVTGIQIYDG